MKFFKGHRGLGRFKRAVGSYWPFRFLNADISLDHGINVYLPSYGGGELWRIMSPQVGTIGGRISLLLSEDNANDLYSMAHDIDPSTKSVEELELDLCYRDRKSKRYTGVKISALTFSCKAGEIVQVSMDVQAKTYEQVNITLTWTDTRKLVTWDKTGISGYYIDDLEDVQSFTYVIDNNLVLIRTAESLLPYSYNQGTQKISGNVTWLDVTSPRTYSNPLHEHGIYYTSTLFRIDTFSITHEIAHHWSYRVPLSPDLILTTLEWSRVDDIVI